jgi:hypothetical protein
MCTSKTAPVYRTLPLFSCLLIPVLTYLGLNKNVHSPRFDKHKPAVSSYLLTTCLMTTSKCQLIYCQMTELAHNWKGCGWKQP